MMRRSVLQRVVLIISGVVLFLLFLEAGLRIVESVYLNLQKHKNLISLQDKDSYRILCLGDSLTAGAYPEVLERVLNERDIGVKFAVIDEGRPGTDSRYIVSILDEVIKKYNPDIVTVMTGFKDPGDKIVYRQENRKKIKILNLIKIIAENLAGKIQDREKE